MELQRIVAVTAREDEGVTIDIVHPENATEKFTMTVAGVNSDRFRKARAEQQRRWIKQKRNRQTPEEILKDDIEISAACLLRWDGLTDGGQPVPFTPENIDIVLRHEWVLKQVKEAMNDEAGFFANRSSS